MGAAAPGALDGPCKCRDLDNVRSPMCPQQPAQPGHRPTTPTREEISESTRRQKSHPAACTICSAKGQSVAALCQEINPHRRVPAHQNHLPGSGFSSVYGNNPLSAFPCVTAGSLPGVGASTGAVGPGCEVGRGCACPALSHAAPATMGGCAQLRQNISGEAKWSYWARFCGLVCK